MERERIERLATLFLAVFSTGLALVMAEQLGGPAQRIGAVLAVAGSLCLAMIVRTWPVAAKVANDD